MDGKQEKKKLFNSFAPVLSLPLSRSHDTNIARYSLLATHFSFLAVACPSGLLSIFQFSVKWVCVGVLIIKRICGSMRWLEGVVDPTSPL